MDIDKILAAVRCLDPAGRRRLSKLLLELAADQGITPLMRRIFSDLEARDLGARRAA